jgi:hypothetical protein
MFDRIMGIVTLKAPVYKAVAEDEKATKEAMIIVVVVSVIQGFIVGLMPADGEISFGGALVSAVTSLITGLVAWYVSAWLLATIAKAFGGKTDTNEMLRVTGYVSVFGLAVLLNLAGLITPALLCVTSIIAIVVLIFRLIGFVIGVREAAEFSTGNAVVTALIASIGSFLISLAGSMLAGLFG